jgi:hypothetical protein
MFVNSFDLRILNVFISLRSFSKYIKNKELIKDAMNSPKQTIFLQSETFEVYW